MSVLYYARISKMRCFIYFANGFLRKEKLGVVLSTDVMFVFLILFVFVFWFLFYTREQWCHICICLCICICVCICICICIFVSVLYSRTTAVLYVLQMHPGERRVGSCVWQWRHNHARVSTDGTYNYCKTKFPNYFRQGWHI